MSAVSVSVVLPCFEEAEGIASVVAAVEHALRAAGVSFEILIVASAAAEDGTLDVAHALAAADARVRVIVQRKDDRGYGRALALGIAAAREPWVLLMDADGQFDPRDVDRLLPLTARADVVVGVREDRRDPLGRRLSGAVYARVLRAVTGVTVRDVDCGFKLVRKDLVRALDLRSRTGVANAELLAYAARSGGRIAEAPVSHAARRSGQAQFTTVFGLPSPREASRMLREAAALAVRLRLRLER